jgi:hypothetical protein
MTKDEILSMAKEAGIDAWWDTGSDWRETFNEHLERFAALVAEKEREAMVAEAAQMGLAMKNEEPFEDLVRDIANDRARGSK